MKFLSIQYSAMRYPFPDMLFDIELSLNGYRKVMGSV